MSDSKDIVADSVGTLAGELSERTELESSSGQLGLLSTQSRDTVIVSSVASDSHTWNLVYLQMLVEELGYEVVNLGPCVPDDLLITECRDRRPALVVISSVNGHGYQDGMRAIQKLRECEPLVKTPVVIGGKLGISGSGSVLHVDDLLAAGFDAVFEDGANEIVSLQYFISSLPERALS